MQKSPLSIMVAFIIGIVIGAYWMISTRDEPAGIPYVEYAIDTVKANELRAQADSLLAVADSLKAVKSQVRVVIIEKEREYEKLPQQVRDADMDWIDSVFRGNVHPH